MSDRGDLEAGDGQHEDHESGGEGKGRGGGRGEYRRYRPRYVRRGGARSFSKSGDGGEEDQQQQHIEEHQVLTPLFWLRG